MSHLLKCRSHIWVWFLRKFGSVSQFWLMFSFVSITQMVLASKSVNNCMHDDTFSKIVENSPHFCIFLTYCVIFSVIFCPFVKKLHPFLHGVQYTRQVAGSMPFIVFRMSITSKTHGWIYHFWQEDINISYKDICFDILLFIPCLNVLWCEFLDLFNVVSFKNFWHK